MKNRMIRFYEEHKTTIVLGSAGLAVAILVTMKKMSEPQITGVKAWSDTNGGYLIGVQTKNGDRQFFDFDPTKV